MSVKENLETGAFSRTRQDLKPDFERVYNLFPVLKERNSQPGGARCRGGEEQMLAMGRALMARPKLLMLDGPSMGLVEQNANVALESSARGYVLETGQVVLSDTSQALLQNPRVQGAYLGES